MTNSVEVKHYVWLLCRSDQLLETWMYYHFADV